MDKNWAILGVLLIALLIFGCTQPSVNPPSNASVNLTNECEKNGGTCTVLGDFAVDTCEMHNWTTLPYHQSCPNLAVNTQCCKKEPNACTQEALKCPDGSYVARTGPNCAFAPCPNCICPQRYIQEGEVCNPVCYYSTPKCLMPSLKCSSNQS